MKIFNFLKSSPKILTSDEILIEIKTLPEFIRITSFVEKLEDKDIKWNRKSEANVRDQLEKDINKLSNNPLLKKFNLSTTNSFPIIGMDEFDEYKIEVINWTLISETITINKDLQLTVEMEEVVNNKNIQLTFNISKNIKNKLEEISKLGKQVKVKNLLYLCYNDLKNYDHSFDVVLTKDNFDNFFEIE